MHPTISVRETAGFRSARAVLTSIGIGALAAACAYTPSGRPLDVGNMAYPQPLPEGNLVTTSFAGQAAFVR